MADRYFVPPPIRPPRVEISGAEAHHMAHVMRAEAGTPVVLFDGSGVEFPAEVARVTRNRVELAVGAARAIDRELAVAIVLGIALPKGDRQKWLVEKAVELGVSRLVPLEATRTVARAGGAAIERLRRQGIEAAKQCGRNRLMEIAPPMAWREWIAETSAIERRYLAHPGGQPAASSLASLSLSGSEANAMIAFSVGPEGGFTTDEVVEAHSAGWTPIDLGSRILRTETAAVALAAMVSLGHGR